MTGGCEDAGEGHRFEDRECCGCGTGLDTRVDDHFVLTEETRPIPDLGDMEFDDWFLRKWYFCPDCSPDVDSGVRTDGGCDGGE